MRCWLCVKISSTFAQLSLQHCPFQSCFTTHSNALEVVRHYVTTHSSVW